MTPSTDLVREAFASAGEKRFFLAQFLYRMVFGPDWKQAILGFAYFKHLDNLVDEDPDAGRALAVLAAQRRFIDDVYAGGPHTGHLGLPERFGAPFFEYDRRIGAPLRVEFETLLDSMEFDTRRRGAVLSAAALDAYVVDLGGGIFRALLYHAAPDVILPPGFVARASRAYLYADALIDLRQDLAAGVINVPAEDVERYGLSLDASDSRLRSWIADRAGRVLDDFAAAFAEGRRLERWTLRFLARLYLSSKRRTLRRFLRREGLEPAPHAAAVCATIGRT
jgi:hypothetical protein